MQHGRHREGRPVRGLAALPRNLPGRRIDAGRVASEKLRGLGGEVADRTEPDHRDAFRQRFPAAEGVQPDVDEPQEAGEG